MERLQARLPACRTASTETLGLHPDWVEASAFAWLASRTLAGSPGNLPGVTGARREAVLGAVYPA
jgi:anhydro-N-acetylmuramic acid kinase